MNVFINGLLIITLMLSGCSHLNELQWDPTTDIAGKPVKIQISKPKTPDADKNQAPPEAKPRPPLPDVIRFPGSGEFIKPKLPTSETTESTQPGDITLNFEGTDVREVVKVVLSDLLGINYIIDPAVQGSVTMSTARPLTRDLLLPTLETMLRMNKAALVYKGGTYYVMPAAAAIQGEVTPQLGDNSQPMPSGYSVRIVPLHYIGVAEMDKILKPLAPEGSIVRIDPVRNLMILAGSGLILNNLLETIETFDVNWIKGLSVGIFRIKNAELDTVMQQIESLIAVQDNNPLSDMFKVIPIQSVNSILVITHQQEYLDQIGDWIERLDQVGVDTEDAPTLFVYRVKHGIAEDLAEMLSQLFSEEGGKAASAPRVAPGMTPAKINSRSRPSTTTPTTKQLSNTTHNKLINKLDRTTDTANNTNIENTINASNDSIASNNDFIGSSNDSIGSSNQAPVGFHLESGVSIVADVANNSLLLRATPAQYKEIEEALEKLDILPLQVLIEAMIVEVSLNGNLNYGLQWYFKGRRDNYTMEESLGAVNEAATAGFNWSLTKGADDVRAVFSAFASDGLLKVLSSPSVMVLDNNQAKIEVGDEISTCSQSNVNNNNDNFNVTYTQKQTGVLLTVTPRVTPGGLVMMEVTQEVSDVDKNPEDPCDVTISKRSIESKVAVQDGQVVILGGMIKDRQNNTQNGVPGLYKAPLLGWLFGQTSKTADRTELVVILAPKVLRDDQDISRITDEFKSKLHGLKDGF